MSLSKLPLPSITQVLVSNGIFVPVIDVNKAPVPALRTVDLIVSKIVVFTPTSPMYLLPGNNRLSWR